MIWNKKPPKPPKHTKYIHHYDPWFAWYPVTLTDGSNRMVWLAWVEHYHDIKVYDTHNMFGGPDIGFDVTNHYRLPTKPDVWE